MKKIIYFTVTSFAIIFIFIASIYAAKPFAPMKRGIGNLNEMDTVDYADIRIYYAFTVNNVNNDSVFYDYQRLEIGAHGSKYYSDFVFRRDSLSHEWGKKNPKAQSAPHFFGIMPYSNTWSEYRYTEYVKDLTKKTLTEYACMPHGMTKHNCKSVEPLPSQNWKTENGTLTVAGYNCRKATCDFRGRHYTAWYTTDIPAGNGPWKFGGLPGLILKVYDKDKLYTFECTKIEKFGNKYPVKLFKKYSSYPEMDRVKLLAFQKDIYKNYFKTIMIPQDWDPGEEPPYQGMELE
jgi:GLPGLI family protein